ncbi:hypothetical protein BDN70DRAFT_936356 [Pholiota conissans]|uniref:DUF6533 domain-containing protein n=1 Tax=Pholiota conissans TaxID=109636 RepID=A0A9P5YSU2_9AGAR|nr:hypothetical protein BDN70DRAFT_936356 [Pholiota conissans]
MDPPLGGSFTDTGTDLAAYYKGLGVVELLQDVRYSLLAVFCLFLYEWIANMDDEVKLIHYSRWSSVKVAYMLCRYYPLLYWPVVLWAYNFNHTPILCRDVLHAIHAFLAPYHRQIDIPKHFLGQTVMFMRAYAFSGRSRTVLAILSLAYGFLIGSDIYLFFANIPVPDMSSISLFVPSEDTGCFPDYSTGVMGERLGVAMLASFLLDFFSLAVVVIYCIKRHTGQIPLAVYFLKQGLVAFALICGTNVVAVIIYFQSHSAFSDVGLPFILATSNIIACRLILSLRKRVIVTESQMSRDHSRLVHEAFAFISNSPADKDEWIIHDPAITVTAFANSSAIQITPRNMQSA